MKIDSPAAHYTHIETSALKKAADAMPDILALSENPDGK